MPTSSSISSELRVLLLSCALGTAAFAAGAEPIAIGSHRQLLVDDFLIASRTGVELQLHPPVRREIVLVRDAPWEGTGSDFERLIRDGSIIRMYYMGTQLTSEDGLRMGNLPVGASFAETKPDGSPKFNGIPAYACYAESTDGIHWRKPDLGLVEAGGSKHNNIVWSAPELDNFTPFLDANPACLPAERYKATTRGPRNPGELFAAASADGLHWSLLSPQPIIREGAFDTQNNAFWDPVRKHYWCYIRAYYDQQGRMTRDHAHGHRSIAVATSPDFRHWTLPRQLEFATPSSDALYTNQIEPYYRAPEILVGFPTRYVDRHVWPDATMRALPDPEHRQRRMKFNSRYGTVVTDGQFMTSRDGYLFHRWDETFIRPGPQRRDNWLYGDGYQSLGLIETAAEDPTAAPELSCYLTEGEWTRSRVRRYTLRVDGFVSAHARYAPGELVTKPLIYAGQALSLNFASSAGGSVRVEMQDESGKPLPGHSLADCDELFGDTLDRTVTWHDRSDLGTFAGRTVRLRLALSDADIYSFQFRP